MIIETVQQQKLINANENNDIERSLDDFNVAHHCQRYYFMQGEIRCPLKTLCFWRPNFSSDDYFTKGSHHKAEDFQPVWLSSIMVTLGNLDLPCCCVCFCPFGRFCGNLHVI